MITEHELIANNQTNHSQKRMQQRAINRNNIDLTMSFGDVIFQNTGSKAFIMTDRALSSTELSSLRGEKDNLKGMVVILSSDNHVITTYKNRNLSKLNKIFGKN